jgi:hypothetical protein
MKTIEEEVAMAVLEDIVGRRVQTTNPTECIDDVKVINYANGDTTLTVKLNIPMSRVHLTVEGTAVPELVGCLDSEL